MAAEEAVKKYNNAEEEAERIDVKKAWIREKTRGGKIPCSKCGKYYFFIPLKATNI